MKNEVVLRKQIGKKIKLARFQANYTQEKLAEKTALSARYISQLERGLAFGSASTITGICNALNINSDFLFGELIKSNEENKNKHFLDEYVLLNEKNRTIINVFIEQLLILQNNKII